MSCTMNKYNQGYEDAVKKITEMISEEILTLENETVCEYDPRKSDIPLLPLGKWGRAISDQHVRIEALKKILLTIKNIL